MLCKSKNTQLLREEIIKKIENNLLNIILLSNKFSISKEEILEIFNYLYEEENNEK